MFVITLNENSSSAPGTECENKTLSYKAVVNYSTKLP